MLLILSRHHPLSWTWKLVQNVPATCPKWELGPGWWDSGGHSLFHPPVVHVGLGAHSRGHELIRACTVSRSIYRDLHPNSHLQEWPEAAQRMCPEEGLACGRRLAP